MQKRPMSVITAGLPTKSAMIRALIAEGYLRTEVAQFLKINYQHVRKVLEDAGIRDGMQRLGAIGMSRPAAARETPNFSSAVAAGARGELEAIALEQAGFVRLGSWAAVDGRIALDTPAPRDPGVYAFVIDGKVMYVGVTHASFHQRMGNYRLGNTSQRTSSRINLKIAEELAGGRRVEIYLATPLQSEWNGLPVNVAAGLEEGLIQRFGPPWNLRSVRGR